MTSSDYSYLVKNVFRNCTVEKIEVVQSLWSGYGEISRFKVTNNQTNPFFCILKYVDLTKQADHPRGWSGEFAHTRKLNSYINELNFYQECAGSPKNLGRIPKLFASQCKHNFIWLLMEDLDHQGFQYRIEPSVLYTNDDNTFTAVQTSQLSPYNIKLNTSNYLEIIRLTIKWLAVLHADYTNHIPESLNMKGTYWHLATRPDELNQMPNSKLKRTASIIDSKLNDATFQTLLHGDAKIANFCFSELHSKSEQTHGKVAAVDFQYVGKGVGVKDLIYFLGSCFDESKLFIYANELIECYFEELKINLQNKSPLSKTEIQLLEKEWRYLICFAWADFERFLQGWAPRHPKLNGYSGLQTKEALKQI